MQAHVHCVYRCCLEAFLGIVVTTCPYNASLKWIYIYNIDRLRVIKVLAVGDQNKMIQMTVIIVQDTL